MRRPSCISSAPKPETKPHSDRGRRARNPCSRTRTNLRTLRPPGPAAVEAGRRVRTWTRHRVGNSCGAPRNHFRQREGGRWKSIRGDDSGTERLTIRQCRQSGTRRSDRFDALSSEREVELLTKVTDIHLDDVLVTFVVGVPDRANDLGLRDHHTIVAHQEFENAVLPWRQVNSIPALLT